MTPMRTIPIAICAMSSALLSAQPETNQIQHVMVSGANIAYVESGRGDPLILVHGGLQDYRLWNDHLAVFAKTYRVIAYSRRNHYPNPVSADGTPDASGDVHVMIWRG